MNFLTTKIGISVLALEVILATTFWPKSSHATQGETNVVPRRSTQRLDNDARIPSFPEFMAGRTALDEDASKAFLEYTKLALKGNGSAHLSELLRISKTQDRNCQAAFFALLAEHFDLATVIAAFKKSDDTQLNAQCVLAIAINAAANEPQAVIDFVSEHNPYLLHEDLLLGQLMQSEILPFERRISLLKSIPKGASHRSALDFLAQDAVSKGRQSERTMLAGSGLFSEQQLDVYSKVYGHRLMAKDLSSGLRFLQENHYRSEIISTPNLREYAKMSARRNLKETKDAISKVTDKRVRVELMKGALDEMVLKNPDDAIALSEEEFRNGNDNGQLLSNSYSQWFGIAPQDAVRSLQASDMEEASKHKILADHFPTLVYKDPGFAQQLLADYSDSVIVDSLRSNFVMSFADGISFEQRVSTASKIEQADQRREVVMHMAQISAQSNKKEIESYMRNASPGPFKDDIIMGYTRTSFYDDSFTYANLPEFVNLASDPELRMNLLKEWYLMEPQGSIAKEILNAQIKWEKANPTLAKRFSSADNQRP